MDTGHRHVFPHCWILTFVILCVVLLISKAEGQLVPPSDVSLQNYNITDFELLVSNITSNLTKAQQEIVMTKSSNILPSVIIPIRLLIALLFDPFLFLGIFMLRNYEPLRSKLVISLILTGINMIGHIPNIMNMMPVMKLLFQSYWNKFIHDVKIGGMNPETFYQNNLDSNRLPTWLGNYIVFENVYCFIEAYVIHALIIASVTLYSIQLGKFILLTAMKNLRHTILNKIQDYKKKRLEKLKNIKLQNKTKMESDQVSNNVSGEGKESSSTEPSGSLSARTESESNTISDYDDIALDLTSDDEDETTSSNGFDEISKKGRIINMIKRAVKYRVVEIAFVSIFMIVWYVLVSVQLSRRKIDKWNSIFQNWDSYSGYCRFIDRYDNTNYSIIVVVAAFGMIPILLVADFLLCLSFYLNARISLKKKGEQISNFFIYYLFETDPFVYRIEAISIIFIDAINLIVFLIFLPFKDNLTATLVSTLFFVFGINFIGGPACNPGITLLRTLWNYILMVRSKKADSKKEKADSNEFQNVQQLVSAPISLSSVEYVISHKKERDLFYQYLKEEYSVENLLFIEDLQTLLKIDEKFVRGKLGKIKEMVKLYLSTDSSIFEINVPSKLIDKELKDYKELMKILSEENIKVDQLPKRIVKDSQTVYFPNLESSKELTIRNLILNLCTPTLFSDLSFEVHKNMLDSYYRFNHSRKWKEYVKSVTEKP